MNLRYVSVFVAMVAILLVSENLAALEKPNSSPVGSGVLELSKELKELKELKQLEIFREGWTDDGVKRTVYKPKEQIDGELRLIISFNGIPGGTDRGHNLNVHQNPYYDYDNDTLAGLVETNDKVAQVIYGERLLKNEETFSLAEKYLMRASRQGYTVGYRHLSDYFFKKEDFVSAYAYKFLMENAGDKSIHMIYSINQASKKLTEKDMLQAKLKAEEIAKFEY